MNFGYEVLVKGWRKIQWKKIRKSGKISSKKEKILNLWILAWKIADASVQPFLLS